MSAPLNKENLKKFVTEVTSSINNLLEENFKSSQRIKLRCYDVSNKFIIFGANNGSIHIYKRRPEVAFLKIIPSKSSSAIHQVEISPKEKNILVSDEAGLVIILENCFEENNFHNHVRSEHKARTITAMKWQNDTRAYIGDNHGSVSVVTIPTLISLALMTTPYESLMDLDSPVIQIDCLSRFLLITTERRAFICDTEREMYKQIGRKNKGTLGSCFFHNFDTEIETIDFENCKLYCARPGLRMWQANFEGEVFYTHNYKSAIPNIDEILRFNEDLIVEKVRKPQDKTLSFGNVFLFNKKYLCVINSRGFYIIDPEQNDLLFHYFSDRQIIVRLIENEIFIWDKTGGIKVFNIFDIEDLTINIHKYKQYKAGIQFVVKYREDVLTWSKYSPNNKLIVNLKDKSECLDENFNEILSELWAYEQAQIVEYLETDDPKIGNIENMSASSESVSEEVLCENIQIMYKQYKLNETHQNVVMPQFTDMLLQLNIDEMSELFSNFAKHMDSQGEELRIEWCYSQLLHHIQQHDLTSNINTQNIGFIKQSFLELNKDISSCRCKFPLPRRNKTEPRYATIGIVLSEYTEIPYLWLHRIRSLKTIQEIDANLALILQFGYLEILQKVRKDVTYDFCDNLLAMFVKLKTGNCLNCGAKFPIKHYTQIPDWEYIGLNLIQYIGPDIVLKLFLNHHEDIPKDELSERFYMACMFAKTRVNSNGVNYQSVDLACNLLGNNDTQTEFKESITAFLMGKIDKNLNGISRKLTCNSCTYCKHLLNHPVLCQIEQLECGHAFHAICLKYIKRICNVCLST